MDKFSDLTETEYLYGVKVEEFKSLRYETALKFRLKHGKDLYLELYYLKKRDYDEEVRFFRVGKAVRHNEKLLNEIYNRSTAVSVTARVRSFCDIVIHTIGKIEESLRTAKTLFTNKRENV